MGKNDATAALVPVWFRVIRVALVDGILITLAIAA